MRCVLSGMNSSSLRALFSSVAESTSTQARDVGDTSRRRMRSQTQSITAAAAALPMQTAT